MKTPTSNCPCNAYQRCQSQLERKDRAISHYSRSRKWRRDEGAQCLQRAVQMASSLRSKTQTGGMGGETHAHSQPLVMSLCTDKHGDVHRRRHDSCTLTTRNQLAFNLLSAASFLQGHSCTQHGHEGFNSVSTEIIAVLSLLTCHSG